VFTSNMGIKGPFPETVPYQAAQRMGKAPKCRGRQMADGPRMAFGACKGEGGARWGVTMRSIAISTRLASRGPAQSGSILLMRPGERRDTPSTCHVAQGKRSSRRPRRGTRGSAQRDVRELRAGIVRQNISGTV